MEDAFRLMGAWLGRCKQTLSPNHEPRLRSVRPFRAVEASQTGAGWPLAKSRTMTDLKSNPEKV
jgi:hypothetical protein